MFLDTDRTLDQTASLYSHLPHTLSIIAASHQSILLVLFPKHFDSPSKCLFLNIQDFYPNQGSVLIPGEDLETAEERKSNLSTPQSSRNSSSKKRVH